MAQDGVVPRFDFAVALLDPVQLHTANDPVIVQLPDLKTAPTPDLAAQQIARNIDLIQRAGVSEWRKLYVDQSSSPIDLQVPGASLAIGEEIVARLGL